ncbi:hypothetical protein [Aquimarina litoralis]|uniref:hypothetical protein n=1 Tax=Aquimarina litoralis TaxID=584605 RepID=UPI001C583437|nr:hypothetical protein [Aquimarina litoralis]MBW1298597.1 hypothetical protein [Aquimarina litoralis]
MKKYIAINLLLVSILFYNCSNEDDVTTFVPISINFAYPDGTVILEDDCINPAEQFSIAIGVNTFGVGPSIPTKVDYTVNGALYSTTFTNDEIKMIPITLQEGTNIAQIVNNGRSSTIHITTQDDFVLVE